MRKKSKGINTQNHVTAAAGIYGGHTHVLHQYGCRDMLAAMLSLIEEVQEPKEGCSLSLDEIRPTIINALSHTRPRTH